MRFVLLLLVVALCFAFFRPLLKIMLFIIACIIALGAIVITLRIFGHLLPAIGHIFGFLLNAFGQLVVAPIIGLFDGHKT